MDIDVVVEARPVTVPATDPRWEPVRDIADLPEHLTREIGHFFEVYTGLEPGKGTDTRGWGAPATPSGWSRRPGGAEGLDAPLGGRGLAQGDDRRLR